MKTLQILLFLCLSLYSVHGQNYAPFPTESAIWKESTEFIGKGFNAWLSSEYEMSGDTLIADVIYKKMYFTDNGENSDPWNHYYIGGLREDDEKTVFFRPDSMLTENNFVNTVPLSFPSDTAEYVIYQFSQLEIGDTLFYENSLNPDYVNVVLNIDSTLVGNSYRKTYEVSEGSSDTSYLIEGIGSSKGLLAAYKSPYSGFGRYQLSCFSEDDLLFENPYEEEVIDCQVGLFIQTNQTPYFSLFPNPTSGSLFLKVGKLKPTEITVLDLTGQVVVSSPIHFSDSQTEIDLSGLTKGIYIVSLRFRNGITVLEKIMKE